MYQKVKEIVETYYCIKENCSNEVSKKGNMCRSCGQKKRFENPKNHPLYGKHRTLESKMRISLAKGGTGIPYEIAEYTEEFNEELKEYIRKRDNRICVLCHKPETENGRKLDVHHLDYNKMNCNPKNLVSLCMRCHADITTNREQYKEFIKKYYEKCWDE